MLSLLRFLLSVYSGDNEYTFYSAFGICCARAKVCCVGQVGRSVFIKKLVGVVREVLTLELELELEIGPG